MDDKDLDNDLLIGEELNEQTESDVDYLKRVGALDYDIQMAREIVTGFDPQKLDKYNDGLIYRAYYVARQCKTMAKGIIAKNLHISTKLLNYYLETYPKVGLALQAGYMDSLDTMKESLVSKLYDCALGGTVTNKTTSTNYVRNQDGELIPRSVNVTEHEVYMTPNVSAQLELLKRLDPAWVPKVQVDINQEMNYTFKVQEDMNVAVDYRKLSPSALQELLASGKADIRNDDLMEVEETQRSVTYVSEEQNQQRLKEKRNEKKRLRGSTQNNSKYKRMLSESENQVQQSIENQNYLEGDLLENGNQKRNRGRKKKDSGKSESGI